MAQNLLETVKNLLKTHEIEPKQRFGQNFLINAGVLAKIIETAELSPEDIVLEIGPGLGVLTEELAKRAKKVIAVEKDREMINILEKRLKDFGNVEIIEGDILMLLSLKSKVQITNEIQNFQLPKNYKVVANLPYYITSPIIRSLLESKNQPSTIVLMVQKEVAQRICANPPDMNLLAVSVQFYAKPKIISYVEKESFWPKPKVESAIIKISQINYGLADSGKFFKLVKAGFSQPRKQLVNNLSKGLDLKKEAVSQWLLENKIKPETRAEQLSLQDWLGLLKTQNID